MHAGCLDSGGPHPTSPAPIRRTSQSPPTLAYARAPRAPPPLLRPFRFPPQASSPKLEACVVHLSRADPFLRTAHRPPFNIMPTPLGVISLYPHSSIPWRSRGPSLHGNYPLGPLLTLASPLLPSSVYPSPYTEAPALARDPGPQLFYSETPTAPRARATTAPPPPPEAGPASGRPSPMSCRKPEASEEGRAKGRGERPMSGPQLETSFA